jgi:hypothetical protein
MQLQYQRFRSRIQFGVELKGIIESLVEIFSFVRDK